MSAVAAKPLARFVRSILIVDGDADARLLYRTVLAGIAETFLEAEDGMEALKTAVASAPGVIVLDTRLLGIDGYSLCSLLRQHTTTTGAAIIIITADASAEDVARATKAGADEVLVKPCYPEDVVAAASRSWQRRHAG